jgi:hypothetical protein
MFKVTVALAVYCNHRLDTAYDGRYLVRLPDRRAVYAEDYTRELAKLHEREKTECHTEG